MALDGKANRQILGQTLISLLLLGVAVGAGFLTAQMGPVFLIPAFAVMLALIGLRAGIRAPYWKTLAVYMALGAFNYYYFYCAKYTGRNPTDMLGVEGLTATPFEQVQKDLFFALILGFGLLKLLGRKLENRPLLHRPGFSHPLMRVVLASVVFSLCRAAFLVFQNESVFNILLFLRMHMEYAVLPALLMTVLIRDDRELSGIYKGMFYTVGIVALLGIVEFFAHGSPFVRSFYGGNVIYRAVSTLQNPNNLGSYLATVLGVFILYFAKNQLRGWERKLFWMSLPLGLACLFMTLSRSSILFFFLSLAITFAVQYASDRRQQPEKHAGLGFRLLAGYGLMAVVSGVVLYQFFDFGNAVKDAAESYLQESEMSNARFFAIGEAFRITMQNPIGFFFGYGEALFDKVLPDNGFALVMLRNGLVGLALYLSVWALGFRICLRNLLANGKTPHFLYNVCFYILSFQFIFSFSANLIRSFPHNMYFWFTIGVLIWLESKPSRTPSQHASMIHPLDPAALKQPESDGEKITDAKITDEATLPLR